MKWSKLIERVAERAEVRPAVAGAVLRSLTEVALEALAEGEEPGHHREPLEPPPAPCAR